jgi:hypothetical protein
MQPPLGYYVPNGMVCWLCHLLYGLKQALQVWLERFCFNVIADPKAYGVYTI